MKTAIKNVLKGFGGFGAYLVITIIIPAIVFTAIKNIEFQGIPIGLSQYQYERIVYWLTAFGLLVSGFAFLNYSSPKQSIRKGVFALVQILVNCLYIWSYKFSGGTDVQLTIFQPFSSYYEILQTGTIGSEDFFKAIVNIFLEDFLMLYMGIYFLTISIKIYDLIDFTLNREKIRAERMK
ncbi:MAG: conserved membrane protein of unknown function [Promethearchaeota archaeon]|nr:MAG: conserved membrane protein of unknown function [Candidatus Lokiarchaeota archaeon]